MPSLSTEDPEQASAIHDPNRVGGSLLFLWPLAWPKTTGTMIGRDQAGYWCSFLKVAALAPDLKFYLSQEAVLATGLSANL